LGAPRPLDLFYFFRIFCFRFQRGAHANSAPVRGAQRAQIPQNLKSEAPKSGPQTFFFCSLFQCFSTGPKQSASAGPQRAQVKPKFKKRGSKKRGPKRFPPVSVFQRGAPKSPRSPERRQTSKFKNLDPKERGPKRVFFLCFSAGSQRVQGPQKRSPKIKNKQNAKP
jgi:hypothetical protein